MLSGCIPHSTESVEREDERPRAYLTFSRRSGCPHLGQRKTGVTIFRSNRMWCSIAFCLSRNSIMVRRGSGSES